MLKRQAGMLLHITSLPGRFGIGKFGHEAVEFASFLADSGFSWWQLLPFGPPASGFSPYQCYSAFAGNPMLVDPVWLHEHDLLSSDELGWCEYHGSDYRCDFAWLQERTEWMLQTAYKRADSSLMQMVAEFVNTQTFWLPDYALYMTIRASCQGRPWWEWPDENLRRYRQEDLKQFTLQHQNELYYHYFVQFIIDRQWHETRDQIHRLGIKTIGDLPIYVSMDSSDVWANSGLFNLDQDLKPINVAGVPPDYFAADGQLWGNPLYNWDKHSQEDFNWWKKRIGQALQWFDSLRLDHFRGFESYWAVPAAAQTAREGQWLPGPREELFTALFAVFGRERFIAEDLGEIDDAVRIFLNNLELPGMRVLQFGFDTESDSLHLPCFYPQNSVAYTGTHDNNTLLGWLWELPDQQREFALRYAGFDPLSTDWGSGGPQAPVIKAMIRTVWSSAADLVIAPLQDFLGYGSDTRMNIPGIASGQWTYRVTSADLEKLNCEEIYLLNRVFRRCVPKPVESS